MNIKGENQDQPGEHAWRWDGEYSLKAKGKKKILCRRVIGPKTHG